MFMKKSILLGIITCLIPLTFIALPAQDEEEVDKSTPLIHVAEIEINGPIAERSDPFAIFASNQTTLQGLLGRIEKAKNDEMIEAIYIRMLAPGWNSAQAMEVYQALDEVVENGKDVYISFDMAGILNYTVASAGSKILMPEVGIVDLHGLNFSLYFMKDMLGKLGVEADVVNVGKFKDALDPLIRNEMGEGTRIQMTALLESFFTSFEDRLAEQRGWDEEKTEEIITMGPYTSEEALELGLVDEIISHEQIEGFLADELGERIKLVEGYGEKKKQQEPPNIFALLTGSSMSKKKSQSDDPKVAVVYALGPISDGRSQSDNPFESNQAIVSDDFVDLLDKVSESKNLKAVVVRVDSPGGSAIASDRIHERLLEFQRDDIPVVVSMGSVAASGGYYISMGADHIFAQDTTITGSIGVIGGKILLADTYDKIGVTKQSLAIGDHSNIYSETDKWTDEERKLLNETLDSIYDTFTAKAADGRGMSQDEIKELGGGRVWSGSDALENGLVDEIGGLTQAIAYAKELTGEEELEVIQFPEELSLLEMIDKIMMGEIQMNVKAPGLNLSLMGQELAIGSTVMRSMQPWQKSTLSFVLNSLEGKPEILMVSPFLFNLQE